MIFHIDMDAFFASVEQKDFPDLSGNPLVVGGKSGRGVVAAASYEARRYGIHSAMPIFMARQRCPGLIIVPPRKHRYKEVSRSIMAILGRYSPIVEQVSIDEAYMDAAGCHRLFGPAEEMARAIKDEIYAKTALTCSIGVAPLKFLAKIASDMKKPDGLTVIHDEDVPDFIFSLPVEKVQGVGKNAFQQLRQLGITTLGDVRRFETDALVKRLGIYGHRLMDLACGRDSSTVTPHRPTKSISTERTLSADTRDRKQLRQHLLSQSQEVGRQLRHQGFLARTITLKLKDADFRQITRSVTIDHATQCSQRIYQMAETLLSGQEIDNPIRLIGIGASALIRDTEPIQMSLFSQATQPVNRWDEIDRTVDRITERFGNCAVHRGSLSPVDDISMD